MTFKNIHICDNCLKEIPIKYPPLEIKFRQEIRMEEADNCLVDVITYETHICQPCQEKPITLATYIKKHIDFHKKPLTGKDG